MLVVVGRNHISKHRNVRILTGESNEGWKSAAPLACEKSSPHPERLDMIVVDFDVGWSGLSWNVVKSRKQID